MSIYAIGDVQGCYDPLKKLLKKIKFKSDRDQLWFVGDLVNRGPKSLKTLRFIKDMDQNAVCVLGNHDLHLLAVTCGYRDSNNKNDTLQEIIKAPDADALLDWLRYRPLLHHDKSNGFTMVHAGLPPQWNLKKARRCAREAIKILRSDKIDDFLANMYGNQPDLWSEDLQGWDRIRFIVNSFTRLRYCDAKGREDFTYNREFGSQPAHLMPWFQVPGRKSRKMKIIFGHWASLGLHTEKNIFALDSACVWGGKLTAMKISNHFKTFQSDC